MCPEMLNLSTIVLRKVNKIYEHIYVLLSNYKVIHDAFLVALINVINYSLFIH